MTAEQRLERDLPIILDEIVMGPHPDYIDNVLSITAHGRQRPVWTFPERWFPMDLVTTRVPQTRLPWRQLGVLALIAILLAAVVAVYVGSQPPTPLPAPFGPARNGLIAYDADGDITVVDARTGEVASIVPTPDDDRGPRFSRDGTHMVFERALDARLVQLVVADVNGANVTIITPDPITLTQPILGESWERYQFSPDGRSVVIAAVVDGIPSILIANADGSGVRRVDIGRPAYEPSFRPPDGGEIMFVGLDGSQAGIHVVDLSTGDVRTVVQTESGYDLAGPSWSPDGSQIAYWQWGGGRSGLNPQTHLIGPDGRGERQLPRPSGAIWSAGSKWSNDGTRIAIVRGYTDDYSTARAVVAPADGSSTGDEVQSDGPINAECCVAFEWSPDDRSILVTPAGSGGRPLPQVLIDVAAGRTQPAPWQATSDPTWQRLAQ